jgi:hypothetical protein
MHPRGEHRRRDECRAGDKASHERDGEPSPHAVHNQQERRNHARGCQVSIPAGVTANPHLSVRLSYGASSAATRRPGRRVRLSEARDRGPLVVRPNIRSSLPRRRYGKYFSPAARSAAENTSSSPSTLATNGAGLQPPDTAPIFFVANRLPQF